MLLILCYGSNVFATPTDTTSVTTNTIATNKIIPNKTAISKDEEVENTVLGIMSYTRWTPPPTPINLCIVAAKHSSILEQLDNTNNTANKIVITKQNFDIAILSTQCDVIYFGDVSPVEQQKVIAARQNRSILTISENDSDCAIGSSFCLRTTTSPITFLVNLDSLARSGVRVDPNVLLLGRKKRVVQ